MTTTDTQTGDVTYRVTANELRQFVERIERLAEESKDIADQSKEVYAELKGRGYTPKIVRNIVADRKKDRDALAEERAVQEMYEQALEGN